jgi:hypothetical protein
MFKGPVGPQSGRTPRSQAEKIGTDPAGFVEGPAYDATAGIPKGAGMPTGKYEPAKMKTPSAGAPVSDNKAPFTVGG